MSRQDSVDSFIDVNAQMIDDVQVVQKTSLQIEFESTFAQRDVSSESALFQLEVNLSIMFISVLKARLQKINEQEKRAQLIADIKTTETRQRAEFSSRESILESDKIFTVTDRAQIQIERELKVTKINKYKNRY